MQVQVNIKANPALAWGLFFDLVGVNGGANRS